MQHERNLDDRIKHVGNLFVDRLDKQLILSAVGYVDFSESTLAVEILCEQLIEYEVQITSEEFQQLQQIATDTGGDVVIIEQLRNYCMKSCSGELDKAAGLSGPGSPLL